MVTAECGFASDPVQPNVIIVLADDFGWGDLSCYGGTIAKTPHLDRMAREGVRFTQAYVASPICSPSRCGIITGQFPARWKITSYLQTRAGQRGLRDGRLPRPESAVLAPALKEAGYATAHVGKWHLGGGRDVTDAPKFAAYGYDAASAPTRAPSPTRTSPPRTGSGRSTTRSSAGTGRSGWSTRLSTS